MTVPRLSAFIPLLAIVVCTATPSPVAAQTSRPYVWKSVTVGAGGFVPGIVFSPIEKGLAYLRSDMGGAYRFDSGEKRWISLQDGMTESSYFGTESIAPDPIDPDVVYIAAGMYRGGPSAIMRSRDKGKTWQTFPVSFRMGGNEDGRGLGERLAIDPNDHSILYFASRHDGLQRSSDFGETWQKVASFPLPGRGLPQGGPTNAGLSFVLFDARTGHLGSATRTLFVASADPGPQHLFRSDDAGQTWTAIVGGPAAELLPVKGAIDGRGVLYLTYCNGMGPNGVTAGAVMKWDSQTHEWADITPDKSPERPAGGYMGISLDRQNPGTLGVTTMNRWNPGDTVWRSADGGKTWADIRGKSERDVSSTPYLLWGQKEARLGWWMSAFAIDPFDSNFAAYATGATIYATHELPAVSKGTTSHWSPWVKGIEQTAVITLLSPAAGAHLISGFGDIGGFVHSDLDASPAQGMFQDPMFGNTNTLDFAALRPTFVVRSGRPQGNDVSLAYSSNGGLNWNPLQVPPTPASITTAAGETGPLRRGARSRDNTNPALITAADGKTLMVMTRVPQFTKDYGRTWQIPTGLPQGSRPIADRINPLRFYALDFSSGLLYSSADGGLTFTASPATGLPQELPRDRPTWSEAAWPLQATPGREGDLWLVSHQGLFHAVDGGQHFKDTSREVEDEVQVEALSFGKAAPGQDYPALFALGNRDGIRAIWRSDDQGTTWLRLNDEGHQWGTRFRCIAADPRIFGRVYIGTDGRGILYGEPATLETPVRGVK